LIDAISSAIRYYGADIVKTTWACSPSIVEPDSFAALRKYTPAAAGWLERLPDAITASDDNRENPAAESSDQRILEFVAEEVRVDPIERIQVRVALTVRATPWLGSFAPPTESSVDVAASAATCTLTLGGTVTVTVCERLEDAGCALAGSEIIVIPSATAISVRRCPTIFRASELE
jgi:hypothetical protein